MPSLSWTTTLQVTGGPTISASANPGSVEAYDRIEVLVDPGTEDEVVEIQPGAAGQVTVLLIHSSDYEADVTFKVSDGANDSGDVKLDVPQVIAGGGLALFGVDPNSLKISNASADKPVTVEIFVGRDATPTP